jgi:hypothetical protein
MLVTEEDEAPQPTGNMSESAHVFSRAIALARRHKCRQLVARGLARRAEVRPHEHDGVG